MVAIELFEAEERSMPAAGLTASILEKAAEKGLILLSCGVYGNVVRILVPITASDAIVDEGLDILEQTVEELTAEMA